ncbi:hypothetical protein GCM10029978_109190 [Actinoallomurus acanthiterrae]
MSLEELLENYLRQVERPKEMRRALDEVSPTATRRDGLVTVAVGPRRRPQDIHFDPKVSHKPMPSEPPPSMMTKNHQQAEHSRTISRSREHCAGVVEWRMTI